MTAPVVDVDAVLDDLERHRRGEVDHGPGLFDVAQFCVWTDGLNSRAVPAPRPEAPPVMRMTWLRMSMAVSGDGQAAWCARRMPRMRSRISSTEPTPDI
mgnify:CR=1 FL=1